MKDKEETSKVQDEELQEEDEQAIGWNAIDNALEKIYGNQEPLHYGTIVPSFLGGNDPIEGISVYKRKSPVPHWHFITYGFTELYEKECEDKEYSGFGFELTLRLKAEKAEQQPPKWALNFLQNIARYVFSSGNGFAEGHYLNANGPIAADTDTQLSSIAFIEDEELKHIETDNGKVQFLQIVGITEDEENAIKCWNCTGLMKLFSEYMPLYITDLNRKSLLDNKEILDALNEGIDKEGSSTSKLFNDRLEWKKQSKLFNKQYEIIIGAHQAVTIGKVLRGRILKKRDLLLLGKEYNIYFKYNKECSIRIDKNTLLISINVESVEELIKNLEPEQKNIELNKFPQLKITIEKTYIKDSNGNIVKTIG